MICLVLTATFASSSHAIDRRSLVKGFGLFTGGLFGGRVAPEVIAAPPTPAPAASVHPAREALRAPRLLELYKGFTGNTERYPSKNLYSGDLLLLRRRDTATAEERRLIDTYVESAREALRTFEHPAEFRPPQEDRMYVLARMTDGSPIKEPVLIANALREMERGLMRSQNLDPDQLYLAVQAMVDPGWLVEEIFNGNVRAYADQIKLSDTFEAAYFDALVTILPKTALTVGRHYYDFLRPNFSLADQRVLEFGRIKHFYFAAHETHANTEWVPRDDQVMWFAFFDLPWFEVGGSVPLPHGDAAVIARYLEAIKTFESAIENLAPLPDSRFKRHLDLILVRTRDRLATELKDYPRLSRNLRLLFERRYSPGRRLAKPPAASPTLNINWLATIDAAARAAGVAHQILLIAEAAGPSEVIPNCGPILEAGVPLLEHQPVVPVIDEAIIETGEKVHEDHSI